MGFAENRRRKQHARSINWPMMAQGMLFGYELGVAEEAGITDHDEQGRTATEVRDAVLDVIGEERFTQALIEADFKMNTADKDSVIQRALETSGYLEERNRLYPS